MGYWADKLIYEIRTAHQQLVLFERPFFGRMLMLDGATQITTRDEFIYQEMMARVPLFGHGNAREVLIGGSGDCAIAKEVLKHKTVRHLAQVEIDAAVVAFAKKHFPESANRSLLIDASRAPSPTACVTSPRPSGVST
jgi:spermidine synthase